MRDLVMVLLFFLTGLGHAQISYQENRDFIIRSFELPDGPSGNSINSIVQGPNGFLWFGGHAGLYRYDGYQFKSYQSNPEDPDLMAFAYIEYLYWSSDGYLWIGTYGGGLYRFDPADESFVRFVHDPDKDTSLSHDWVTTILEENDSILWVGTIDGLNRLDRKMGKFERFRNDPQDPTSLNHNDVRKLYIDRQGTLWVGTGFIFNRNSGGGLNRFNPDTRSFTHYLHHPGDPTSLMGSIVKAIYEDSQGTFWVGSSGGLQKMNRKSGTFQRMIDDPNLFGDIHAPGIRDENELTVVYDLLEDHEKNLWVFSLHNTPGGSLGSIGIVDLANGRMDLLEERKPIVPWQALQSKDGSIWLAGAGVGGRVHQIVPGNSQIQYLPFRNSEDITLQGLVSTNDSTIWGKATSEDGTVQLVGVKNDSFKEWGIRALPEIKSNQSAEISFSSAGGRGLVMDDSGALWGCTGSWNGGLFSIHPETPNAEQYLHDPDNPDSPASNKIHCIIKGQNGNIWMAGTSFFSELDPETGKYRHFWHDPENPASVSAGSYGTIFEDRDGYIWGAGNSNNAGGTFLERLNPETGEVIEFELPPEFSGRPIIAISQNLKGDIYYLLYGVGLRRMFSESLKLLSRDQRYSGETVSENSFLDADNMVVDNNGIFWLTSEQGKIFRFDSETQSTIEFSDQSGLEFEIRSAFKLDDGSIYFQYQDGGLVKIQPSDSEPGELSHNTEVRFTEFRLNGQEVSGVETEFSKSPIWKENQINLPYDKSNFSFRFSAFDFKDPDKSQYEVRLLPLESTWRPIEGDPTVNYFQLPPGDYTLEVRGADSNGVWAEETAKMDIAIAPPWWRSWWAYVLYALLAGFLGYRFHLSQKARTIRQEREKAKDRELGQAREIEKAYKKLQNTQEQLIQSEKMASLGELTAGIAHEIQNPLNFVNNFSEVSRELLEEMVDELGKGDIEEVDAIAKDVIQNLDKIVHHGKRADSIVKGMLQHSRSGDGKKEPTDLNALADEYFRLAYHGLRAKDKSFNASMETDFDPSLPKVDVIPQDIGRVLLNLITNAFHAVSERKEKEPGYEPIVWVNTRKTADGVEISVRDNGGGIPEAIRDKIFQPFFTTKPTGEGTGLGLSMSYDIVTKGHGGKLQVSSKEGQGTTFSMTLPA